MIRSVFLVVALAGCDVLWNIDKVSTGDGGPAAEGMIQPACTMVGKFGAGIRGGMFTHCIPPDAMAVTIDHDFTTGSNPLCRYFTSGLSHDVPLCVIEGHTITVSGNVAVTGKPALVLAAADTLTIDGRLDLTGVTAAGGSPGFCDTATGLGQSGGGGTAGGGGAGGSWKKIGGAGGLGAPLPKARPGMKQDFPDDIRGGCGGGDGGTGTTGLGGTGGVGGGAVYLIAKTAIHLTANGVIDASGRPGHGGTGKSGGGGGGGGGFIGIDSTVFTYDPFAQVFANGGGGAGGGSAGMDGGVALSPPEPASPGILNGGAGAANDSQGTDGGDATATGGGGGGGGEGHVVIFTPIVTPADRPHISPDPTPDL